MNDQGEMVLRDTDVITRDQTGQEFLRPERLRLQLSSVHAVKAPLDIGSLAYMKRGARPAALADRGVPVVELSLVVSRRKLIINLLDWLVVGNRATSVASKFYIVAGVVSWMNDNGYVDIFRDAGQASEAYALYTDYLNGLILSGKYEPRTAGHAQNAFKSIVKMQLPNEYQYVLRGAITIPSQRNVIRPPKESDVQMYKDVAIAIARRYSKFLLEHEAYPCVVKIRDYEVVKFPSLDGVSSPFRECYICYSVEYKRIATVDEYNLRHEKKKGFKLKSSAVERAVANAQVNFDIANADGRHYDRILMAALALKAYAALVSLITGASPTELEQFEYEEALELEKSVLKKELTAIKFRAGGKKTGYVIGRKEGLPILKEYLKLRKWVLDGQYYGKLFFSLGNRGSEFGKVFYSFNAVSNMHNFYNSISGTYLDLKYPNITSRKIRKHKSNAQHTAHFAPGTVAESLGHTRAVNLLAYSEATIEQQESEFGTYWESVRHAAQMVRERSANTPETAISIAAGHCEAFNSPTPVSSAGAVVIEPNCRTQYGCLYCTQYVCHSDEEDVHKLVSLQYVINAVRNMTADSSHAEALYKDLSIRIEFVLEAIADRSDTAGQIVAEMKNKVFDLGVLTLFWESRLQRYETMGVIF